MTSALTPTGSTRAWRKLRAHHAELLELHGSLDCWRCPEPITPATPWDLGHRTDRALGGNDTDLAPEHRHCSRTAGGRLSAKLRHLRGRQHRAPSRSW